MTAILTELVTHYEEAVLDGEPPNGALVEVRAGTYVADYERDDALPGQLDGDWWLLNADGVRVTRMSWAEVTSADEMPVHVSRFFPIEVAA